MLVCKVRFGILHFPVLATWLEDPISFYDLLMWKIPFSLNYFYLICSSFSVSVTFLFTFPLMLLLYLFPVNPITPVPVFMTSLLSDKSSTTTILWSLSHFSNDTEKTHTSSPYWKRFGVNKKCMCTSTSGWLSVRLIISL